ncbi:MAG TPA: RNA 2',3'-cyclic phosphodiesterase [Gaiellaceae bacterium]|nr:RNA 2',3'-cyclic phosphodiesterase [Gaiellaceae bacterium]
MRAPPTVSVGGRERLRLFIALPLPPAVVGALERWQRETLASVRGVRVVPRPNLHVTVAFLGARPATDVGPISEAMRDSAARADPPVLTPSRYRETRSVGMVVLDDEGGHATRLAAKLFRRLERLGVYERERREWLPHVTVLRFRERPRLVLEPPALGAVSPSEVALYHSVLRRDGAQYEVVESVALGG